MIDVTHIQVFNIDGAIRGMRNPVESWDKCDTTIEPNYDDNGNFIGIKYNVGPNDLKLMRNLYNASLSGDNHAHRKYLRQIFISMDINAPLYWWKEMDQYKIGTTSDSESTMHCIAKDRFVNEDFSIEHLDEESEKLQSHVVHVLNAKRNTYLQTKDKEDWWQLIQLLPTTYNQKRTYTFNYEVAVAIYMQRRNHKLDEWNKFIEIMLEQLPYFKDIVETL